MKITVCIGSSCHLKGSKDVVERIQQLVADNNLQDKVELESETLKLEGDVPTGNFRLYQGGICVGTYQYQDGQMKIQTEGEEALATLLAFALECF